MTIPLSCCKYPAKDDVFPLWRENLPPLKELLLSLTTGIRALVTNEAGDPLRNAKVQIESTIYNVSKNMAYFLLTLTPGDYKFTFSCEGYESVILSVHINEHVMSDFNVILKQSKSAKNFDQLRLSESSEYFKVLNANYMQITELKSIGKSSTGNIVVSLRISSQKGGKFEKPSLVFMSGIGAGDPLTSKILTTLATYILKQQERSKRIRSILEKVDLYFVPEIYSNNGKKACSTKSENDGKFNEPLAHDEQMLVNWFEEINPILTVNLKTGARTLQTSSKAQEFETFLNDLVNEYKKYNPMMDSQKSKCEEKGKKNLTIPLFLPQKKIFYFIFLSITVENSRNITEDSLMNYAFHNSNSLYLNIYVSCCNTDNAEIVWNENRESLFILMGAVNKGVFGLVVDEKGDAIENALLSHDSSPHRVKTFKNGAFWMLLTAGSHVIKASAPGHIAETRLVDLPELLKFSYLKFQLRRDKNVLGMPRLAFVFIAGELIF